MDTIEAIAIDYIRPHRGKLSPGEIMKLPPADFQGWHIEMEDEAMRFSNEQETHTLSLKKIIVQIDNAQGGLFGYIPATPRELAKHLIQRDVEKHHHLNDLAYSGQGGGWYGYNASIGGYVQMPVTGNMKYIDCWHIAVSEFQGDKCADIFDLREIYHEIEMELKQGFTLVQTSLFS